MMTGVLSIIAPGSFTQLSAGLLMARLSTIAVTWARLYNELRDNVIAVLFGTLIILTFTSAFLMKSMKLVEDSYEADGLGAVLIAATVLIVVIFLAWAWHSFSDFSRSSVGLALKALKSSMGGSNVAEDNGLELTKRGSTFAGLNPMHEPKKKGGKGEVWGRRWLGRNGTSHQKIIHFGVCVLLALTVGVLKHCISSP